MRTFHGIQVYEILEGGNLLNGVYTNDDLLNSPYGVDKEIARRRSGDTTVTGIEGTYDCSWVESMESKMYHCELEIKKRHCGYFFTWKIDGVDKWKGIGLLAGANHIAVSYIDL